MVSCNNEIYKRACEFFTIAELAQRIAIETYDFTAAFNANLAFSIELFLKSLSATPIEKVTLQVGSATLKTRFAKSAIKGHYLDEIFSKLPNEITTVLSDKFVNHNYNVSGKELDVVLGDLSDRFITSRYAFEVYNGSSSIESETLFYLSKFFKETLQP